jgi:hypothetical protein
VPGPESPRWHIPGIALSWSRWARRPIKRARHYWLSRAEGHANLRLLGAMLDGIKLLQVQICKWIAKAGIGSSAGMRNEVHDCDLRISN